ncbi:NAD-dependent epimerase/dehydratase family protein [Streptococcus suis]|nr:NAD-dependent epimerase/dehydratase family protein [Streptococcus suis]NQP59370.1 NAD-dependent epimerase/dehydratase family protein [Streptococcus suis]
MINLIESLNYRKDINAVLDRHNFEELRNKSIIITGATGLIGSAVVDMLLELNSTKDYNIKIFACSRTEKNFLTRFGSQNENLFFVKYDATLPVDFNFKADYLIHAASNASPELYINYPVDTMLSNFIGMKNLLDYALDVNIQKVLYISSSEVYGILDTKNPIKEDLYGTVDILDIRSSYSSSKRATETLCMSYVEQYGLNVSIVRPGHIYGPTFLKNDNRVSSYFVNEAINGHDLIMKSTGEQIRSYCHCLDCASGILTVLVRGGNTAYNISNKDSIISIRTMANIISQISGVELTFDLPGANNYKEKNPMLNASLDSNLIESLGWSAEFTPIRGFQNTIAIIKELKNSFEK